MYYIIVKRNCQAKEVPKKKKKNFRNLLQTRAGYGTIDEETVREGHMKGENKITDILLRKNFLARLSKWLVLSVITLVGIIVIVRSRGGIYAGFPAWYFVLPAVVLLIGENAVKMWAVKKYSHKIPFYVLDILLLLIITIFTDGMLISTFYIAILSEFYIGQESLSGNIAMGASSIVTFIVTLIVSGYFRGGGRVNFFSVVSSAFNDLILLVLHFLIVNFTIQIWRKNMELDETMKELSESNKELKRLNEERKAFAILEERQRIAKDIHDTAGHSITTVIMQTEAAKLVIDKDPEDAKKKITAANLQARHALEELRESVHLLSGSADRMTLKECLLAVAQESMEGTGITVRCSVEDIDVSDAKRRFLCNTLKEGVSNGLRHGGATAFLLELRREENNAVFLLSDNGSGMAQEDLKEGFGLSGMRARAEALGGKVRFVTEKDEGFEIHITLPIEEKKNGEGK